MAGSRIAAKTLETGHSMNAELEAYFAAARNAPVPPQAESAQRRQERADFPGRFLEKADATLESVLDSTAATLKKHGYGATVELVRDQSGADPNTFPYIILHFSSQRCPPADLGYIYTLGGASVSFICRRNDLCVEAVDRKSTRLNSSHLGISYAVFCLKKKK